MAIRIVTSERRMCGSTSKMAFRHSCRGWARVISQTEIATRWPGLTSAESGALSIGWRMAFSSVPCDVVRRRPVHRLDDGHAASGRSTSRPLVP